MNPFLKNNIQLIGFLKYWKAALWTCPVIKPRHFEICWDANHNSAQNQEMHSQQSQVQSFPRMGKKDTVKNEYKRSFSNSGGSYETEWEQGGDAEQVLGSIIK